MSYLLTILGVVAIASVATLALFAIDPHRSADGEDEHEPDGPPLGRAAIRRAPAHDGPGRQLVLRLERGPDPASGEDREAGAARTRGAT